MKPFDQSAYDADDSAKYVVLNWINHNMPKLERHYINPDQYGVDILGGLGAVEVEVRHGWSGSRWPFPDVRIPVRKRKFLDPTIKTWFVIVNQERTHGMVIDGRTLFDAPVRLINVPQFGVSEYFMVTRPGLGIDLSKFSDTVTDLSGSDRTSS